MQEERIMNAPPQKKEKPLKTVPLKAVPKPAGKAAEFPEKNKHHISMGGILCVLIILLVAAAVAAVYFDLGGAKNMAVSALKLDKPTAAQLAEIDTKQKDLADAQAKIEQETADQKKTAGEIDKKQAALQQQQTAISMQQAELDKQKQSSETDKATIAIFEQMDPAVAANVIQNMASVDDMVKLLTSLKSDKAALIMDHISQNVATQIATQMVK